MPYGFYIDPDAHPACVAWCKEQFGRFEDYDQGRWSHRIATGYYKYTKPLPSSAAIYFKNEVDAMAFKLRWL